MKGAKREENLVILILYENAGHENERKTSNDDV